MAASASALVQPNLYKLSNSQYAGDGKLNVSYLTHSGPATQQFPQGPPRFTYDDGNQTLSFAGTEVDVAQTELGTIVSVVIRRTIDLGSTTFSLLVPRVNLVPGQPAAIQTDGITANHKLPLAPGLGQGQQDEFSVTPLQGTASDVIVPL
jgi:hypothetical protein